MTTVVNKHNHQR